MGGRKKKSGEKKWKKEKHDLEILQLGPVDLSNTGSRSKWAYKESDTPPAMQSRNTPRERQTTKLI